MVFNNIYFRLRIRQNYCAPDRKKRKKMFDRRKFLLTNKSFPTETEVIDNLGLLLGDFIVSSLITKNDTNTGMPHSKYSTVRYVRYSGRLKDSIHKSILDYCQIIDEKPINETILPVSNDIADGKSIPGKRFDEKLNFYVNIEREYQEIVHKEKTDALKEQFKIELDVIEEKHRESMENLVNRLTIEQTIENEILEKIPYDELAASMPAEAIAMECNEQDDENTTIAGHGNAVPWHD